MRRRSRQTQPRSPRCRTRLLRRCASADVGGADGVDDLPGPAASPALPSTSSPNTGWRHELVTATSRLVGEGRGWGSPTRPSWSLARWLSDGPALLGEALASLLGRIRVPPSYGCRCHAPARAPPRRVGAADPMPRTQPRSAVLSAGDGCWRFRMAVPRSRSASSRAPVSAGSIVTCADRIGTCLGSREDRWETACTTVG